MRSWNGPVGAAIVTVGHPPRPLDASNGPFTDIELLCDGVIKVGSVPNHSVVGASTCKSRITIARG